MSENKETQQAELQTMLRQTQERQAAAWAAIVQAAYWIDHGASGRALAVLRAANEEFSKTAIEE